MSGLEKLYQSIRTAALKQQRQPQIVSVFTTKLLAYYFRIKHQILAVTSERCQFKQTLSGDEFQRYKISIGDTPQLFIGDVLLFLSVSRLLKIRDKFRLISERSRTNTPELIELLQASAVKHLTTYSQLLARDFGSAVTIVTTDFETLYAYKRGDYQQCLQLSTQNVHALLYAVKVSSVSTFPEFIQLLDDDIVSLTALTLIVIPRCRDTLEGCTVSQLTLSLYLMTQCQLKLHHSVTSLVQTLDYIEVAQIKHPAVRTLDKLTLKLTERKLIAYVTHYSETSSV